MKRICNFLTVVAVLYGSNAVAQDAGPRGAGCFRRPSGDVIVADAAVGTRRADTEER